MDVTLQNVKDGSRYYIYNETTDKVVSTGLQSGTSDIVVYQVPYNGVDETLRIEVRKASESPYYRPFETNAILTSTGASVWVSQIRED